MRPNVWMLDIGCSNLPKLAIEDFRNAIFPYLIDQHKKMRQEGPVGCQIFFAPERILELW